MPISKELQIHLQGIDEPNKDWEKMEFVFGKQNEIQGHQLENEFASLNPSEFYFSYRSNFKTLRTFVEEFKIDKPSNKCIYVILSKLGPSHFVFVSVVYSME